MFPKLEKKSNRDLQKLTVTRLQMGCSFTDGDDEYSDAGGMGGPLDFFYLYFIRLGRPFACCKGSSPCHVFMEVGLKIWICEDISV